MSGGRHRAPAARRRWPCWYPIVVAVCLALGIPTP